MAARADVSGGCGSAGRGEHRKGPRAGGAPRRAGGGAGAPGGAAPPPRGAREAATVGDRYPRLWRTVAPTLRERGRSVTAVL